MDRPWFDREDMDMNMDMDMGLGLNRRWTSLSPAGVAASFLEESRSLEAASARLRDAVASSRASGLLASRRLDIAHTINSFMRNAGDHPVIAKQPTHPDLEELTKNFRAMKEENLKLRAVITDVTEVNKRWQKYNNDRQMYVQRLLSTIQEQQEQINKMAATSALAPPPRQDAEVPSAGGGGETSDEVSRLRQRLEHLQREHGETVQVLKFQVKAHHDDWVAERTEKQQALQDKLAAELRVRQLQKDLRAHKLKLREERLENDNRCSCCCVVTDSEGGQTAVSGTPDLSRSDNTKTYRTSVHVPCNEGHLLSRGGALSVNDDLAIDSPDPTALSASRPEPDRDRHTACLSCTVLPESGSSSSLPETSTGVTIGFGDDGLASVLSFRAQSGPIAKSSSLPSPTDALRPAPDGDKMAASAESLVQDGKLSLLGAFAKSVKHSGRETVDLRGGEKTGRAVGSSTWTPSYFEEGVDTQTREDIICPVCNLLFPPNSHLKFLDHFGKCQNVRTERKPK